jgi:alkanesulfonate monooxygenase SsuD/methylene tetrahydromethanopterin reductase-like flavin-dependent oxidoreductase (luciferase family)
MGLNIIQAATLSPIDELKDLALQAKRILVKKGRSPESLDFPLLWITHVAKTLEEARARSEEPLKWYYNKIMSLVPRGSFSPKSYEAFAEAADAWFAAGGIPVEKLNELGNLVMGTPEYAAKRMAEVHNDIGQQEVILWMQIGGMEDNYVRDSMKRFADEVFPILKGKPAVVPPTLAEIAASRS